MKKIIILFAVLSFCGLQSQAQFQKPFPDSVASWRIHWRSFDTYPTLVYYSGAFDYVVGEDTTLNGYNYRTLYKDYSVVGFYRRDSLKVYFRRNGEECCNIDTTEKLLYDFGMIVGDSIQIVWNYEGTPDSSFLTVVSIDTVFINNDTLRQWHFQGSNGAGYGLRWIEGLGSDAGFFTGTHFFEGGENLACFHENAIDYVIESVGLSNDSSNYCLTVGIEAKFTEKKAQIFPNPTSGHIRFTNANGQIATVSLHDVFGRCVKVFSVQTNSLALDLSDLNDGVYLAKITSKAFAEWQKVVLRRE